MVPSLRVGAPQRVSTGDPRSALCSSSSALEALSCALQVLVLWENLLTSSSQTATVETCRPVALRKCERSFELHLVIAGRDDNLFWSWFCWWYDCLFGFIVVLT